MRTELTSLATFDAALSAEYASVLCQLPDKPEAFVQRRFSESRIFPTLGWALIGVGDAQALATNDPALLHGTIVRFTKCAHACWGWPGERGLHWGGVDYCALVVPGLYSSLLGKSYLASVFQCGRSPSTMGHGALKHAANLMVCLACNTWPHKDKAIANARSFALAKSNAKADRAFVSFFLALLEGNRPQVSQALVAFTEAYLKSDWGRHKPLTKPTFLQAMVVYASFYLSNSIDEQTHRTLLPAGRFELWKVYERRRAEFERDPHLFVGPLSFLNDVAVH